MKKTLLIVGVLVVAALFTIEGRGQEPDTPVFSEITRVELVNIEVFVTDKSGRPITGLTRDDFRVNDGGKKVEVTHFSEYQSENRVESPPEDAGPEAVSEDLTRTARTEATSPPPSHPVVVYLDNLTMTPPARSRVMRPVQAFVEERAAQGDKVKVMAYSPGLESLTPFTTDAAVLDGGLEVALGRSAMGMEDSRERQAAMIGIREVIQSTKAVARNPCDTDGWAHMMSYARNYAATSQNRAGMSLHGLGELIRSLGGLEGRKTVLYVGGSFQQSPGLDLFDYLGDQVCPEMQQETMAVAAEYETQTELLALTASANANRVTLYALDAAGVRGLSSSSVEFGGPEYTPGVRNDNLRIANLQNSLFVATDETGGYAILNANQPAADLERVSRDFTHYYSLGYPPPENDGGKTARREIDVELRKGRAGKHDLRYRRSYVYKSSEERMAERTLATVYFEAAENPLGVEVNLGPVGEEEAGTRKLPIEVSVPLANLTTLPHGDKAQGVIRIMLTARDERGGLSKMLQKRLQFEVGATEAAAQGAVHTFRSSVSIGPGAQTLAISVRDEPTAVTSYLLETVEPAS